jgi:2-oxoglutarate ferredoxin oxidoreductase subunit beta
MKTYGFHSLHGRALPIACGIRSRRPELNIFVITGDGDCCAIGTSHWFHAVRYNMNLTVLMFNNTTYALTKMQTSPTAPKGEFSLTHPRGALLSALNPLEAVLGITNASFAARTTDWNNPHLYETLKIAHHHPGFAFVEVIQRCPHYKPNIWNHLQDNPDRIISLVHPDAVTGEGVIGKAFPHQQDHDPTDLAAARELAQIGDKVAIGILYQNKNRERYDRLSIEGMGMSDQGKLDAIEQSLDRLQV